MIKVIFSVWINFILWKKMDNISNILKFNESEDKFVDKIDKNLGPIVQSIVSLTSSLTGQLVKCFTTL